MEPVKEKIQDLFKESNSNDSFENHMPAEVGLFLEKASIGVFDAGVIEEDVAFAKSISKVFDEQ